MLHLLETGNAIYVLAAVCILSMAGKLIVRSLYKRLIKETDNMTLTKNKYLRALKQKAETTYRVNQGAVNTRVFLERQFYGIKFLGLSVNRWSNVSGQLTLLCFLLGCAGAFTSYWYRLDSYYVVLYGSLGILTGLLSMVLDSGVNQSERRQQLLVSLQDYMENSFFTRLAQGRGGAGEETGASDQVRPAARETRLSARENASRRGNARGRREPAPEPVQETVQTSRKDIDYLRRSLEQIAASREKNQVSEDWIKDLNPEEIKLIGEILSEYLA